MTYQDPGLPDDEITTTCPDCLGRCSLEVRDRPGAFRWLPCHRCESTGEIGGKDAAEVLAEKDEAAREREAELGGG